MIKMAIKMLLINRKKALSLIINLSIVITMSGIIVNMIENPNMQIEYLLLNNISSTLSILYFFIIVICIWLVSYSCMYYIRVSSREFALIKLAGYDSADMIKYMLIQNSVIIGLATIIAGGLILIFIPAIQFVVYHYLSINKSAFYIAPVVFYECFILLLLTLIIMIFLDLYFINQIKLSEMIEAHNIIAYKTDKRIFKMPSYIFLILYFLGIIILFQGKKIDFEMAIMSLLGAVGAYGLFYYVVPNYLQARIDTKRLKPLDYVIYGDVSLFLQQSKMLAVLAMITTIVIPIMMYACKDNFLYFLQMILIAVLSNILTWLTLYSRFKLDFQEKRYLYQNMYKMGLTWKEISKIIIKELLMIFLIFGLLSGIYLLTVLMTILSYDYFDFTVLLILLDYLIPMLFCLLLLILKRKGEIKQWKK